jgi:tRNA nucleotidyltransferase (CCA-adding enzyme)
MEIQQILSEEIEKVKPSEEENAKLEAEISEIVGFLNKKLKGKAIVILGGSFAKGTVIKKGKYDADIFVKFHKNPDSDLLERTLKKFKVKIERLHGSRDYFRLRAGKVLIEIVPILNLNSKDTEKAVNVTDVSPFHVSYIKKKIDKNKKLADEIRLAKAFCYALGCYGAESHIRGFSGYCLEVLVSYYKSFLNLLKASSKWPDKVVLDPEKYYKKGEVMRELNESKLISPLIIVDPVQKNRNISAALSEEKFNLFRESCKKFLSKPSKEFFEMKDVEKDIMNEAKKSKMELLIIQAESLKDKEDIAGAKLLKFQNVLKDKLEKEGYTTKTSIKFSGSSAKLYFLLGKKDLVIEGPFLNMPSHVMSFRKKWKKAFIKGKRIVALKKKTEIQWKNCLKIDKKVLADMDIKNFRVLNQSKI